jgi:hypothetical protein
VSKAASRRPSRMEVFPAVLRQAQLMLGLGRKVVALRSHGFTSERVHFVLPRLARA